MNKTQQQQEQCPTSTVYVMPPSVLGPAGEVTGEDVARFNALLAEEIFADQRIDTDAYWALVTDSAERWAAQSKSNRNTWCTLLDRNLQTPMPDDFRAAVERAFARFSVGPDDGGDSSEDARMRRAHAAQALVDAIPQAELPDPSDRAALVAALVVGDVEGVYQPADANFIAVIPGLPPHTDPRVSVRVWADTRRAGLDMRAVLVVECARRTVAALQRAARGAGPQSRDWLN